MIRSSASIAGPFESRRTGASASLNEDRSRIRNKPATFARFRSFALNFLRANAVANIRRELYVNAFNSKSAMAYAVT